MDVIIDYFLNLVEWLDVEVCVGVIKYKFKEIFEKKDKKGKFVGVVFVVLVFKVFYYFKEGVISFVWVYYGIMMWNVFSFNMYLFENERFMGIL